MPGTTRDVIEIPVAVDGLPFVLVDTAGLRSSDDRVERIGIARAEAELARADVLLWLGDPAAPDSSRGCRGLPAHRPPRPREATGGSDRRIGGHRRWAR